MILIMTYNDYIYIYIYIQTYIYICSYAYVIVYYWYNTYIISIYCLHLYFRLLIYIYILVLDLCIVMIYISFVIPNLLILLLLTHIFHINNHWFYWFIHILSPTCSMYGIFTYITGSLKCWHIYQHHGDPWSIWVSGFTQCHNNHRKTPCTSMVKPIVFCRFSQWILVNPMNKPKHGENP